MNDDDDLRSARLKSLAEHYGAPLGSFETDCPAAWALLQYRAGRGPTERLVSVWDSAGEACSAAVDDDYWHPELLVDLDEGQCFPLTVRVTCAIDRQQTLRGATSRSLKPSVEQGCVSRAPTAAA